MMRGNGKGLDAYQLKLFMAGLMVLDHIKIIPGLVSPTAAGVLHLLTRSVGVWFAYLAVEGFLHTRNRIRYNGRLFLWAAFMEGGNLLLNLWLQSAGIVVYNNIFLTLAFGVLVLNLLFNREEGPRNPIGYRGRAMTAMRLLAAVLAIGVGALFGEGGILLIPFMLITYLLRNNTKRRNIGYAVFAVLLFAMSFQWYPGDLPTTLNMLLMNSEWAFVSVIPFLALYNGERGRNDRFSKYFFYVFYPAHLWILAVIAFWMSK